jgi:hypothetical protein
MKGRAFVVGEVGGHDEAPGDESLIAEPVVHGFGVDGSTDGPIISSMGGLVD